MAAEIPPKNAAEDDARNWNNCAEREEFFTDKLLIQIHSIIEMILVDRPCAIGV